MGSKSQQSRETSLQVESLQHPTAPRSSQQQSVSRSSKQPSAPQGPPPSYSPPREPQIIVHQNQQQVKTRTLNKNDPMYTCCCGTIHIKNGAIAVGIVEVILNLLGILGLIAMAAIIKKKEVWEGVIVIIFIALIVIAPCYCCYFAVFPTKQPAWFIGYLVLICFYLFIQISGAVFEVVEVVLLFKARHWEHGGLVIGSIFFTLMLIVLRIWFFYIVIKCWKYYNDCKQQAGAVLRV